MKSTFFVVVVLTLTLASALRTFSRSDKMVKGFPRHFSIISPGASVKTIDGSDYMILTGIQLTNDQCTCAYVKFVRYCLCMQSDGVLAAYNYKTGAKAIIEDDCKGKGSFFRLAISNSAATILANNKNCWTDKPGWSSYNTMVMDNEGIYWYSKKEEGMSGYGLTFH